MCGYLEVFISGKLFKNQELERTALVAKWQDAVKHLRQRDADIQRINGEIYMTELAIENQQEIVQEQNDFLNNEKVHNKATEEEINELNGVNSRIRKELNDLLQYILRITNEVPTTFFKKKKFKSNLSLSNS